MSLSIPERVRFRYRLEGLETNWHEAGARRTAFYTDPRPGSYRFHVIACNNDGVWNEAGAVTGITIQAAFFQTDWFIGLCTCAVGGLLWLLYLSRLKRATARLQNRFEERLSERQRIARELHDTLLQGFQGLILHFQAVLDEIPDHEAAHKTMRRALNQADQVLIEGRERVQSLRLETGDGTELSEQLSSCGEELAHRRPVEFKVTLAGAPLPLHPVVGDELFRIGREALSNAFRHSQASKVEVELTYDRASFCMRVRDNGSGIDEEILESGRKGHWGLSGMRERTQGIGGELKIWSKPGGGTEIDLHVPAKAAYVRRPTRSPWSRVKQTGTGRS